MDNIHYIPKSKILESLILFWIASMLRLEAYRAKGKEAFQTMIVLHGSSGIGKTAIMKSFAKFHAEKIGEFFSGIIKLNIPAMADTDFEIPLANHEQGTVEKITSIKFGNTPKIIQCDEINRYSTPESVNAFTRVVLDGDGTEKPADGSLVIGCANSTSYAGTKRFPDHLVSRCVHVYVTENDADSVACNVDYMHEMDLPEYGVQCFKQSPTRSKDDFSEIAEFNMRSYEFALYICKAFDECSEQYGIQISDTVFRSLVYGAIGSTQGSKLIKERTMTRLPTMGEVMNDPMGATIPDINLDAGLKRKYCETLIEQCDTAKKADKLAQYFKRMGAEYSRYLIETLADKVTGWNAKPFLN